MREGASGKNGDCRAGLFPGNNLETKSRRRQKGRRKAAWGTGKENEKAEKAPKAGDGGGIGVKGGY